MYKYIDRLKKSLFQMPYCGILKKFFLRRTANTYKKSLDFFRNKLLHYLLLYISIFGTIAYIPSIYYAFEHNQPLIIILDTTMLGAVLFILIKNLSFRVKSHILLSVFYILGAMLLLLTGPTGAGFFYLLLFSAMSSVLLGSRHSFLTLGINIFTTVIIGVSLNFINYTWTLQLLNAKGTWIILGTNFICINAMISISVSFLINQLNRMFQKERKIKIKIQKEISSRKKTEEQNLSLNNKLMLSQKMETLGLLAGGVAHDLNNILSAQVAYPEMIMLDLPDNSPHIPALEKIHESGLKASAIVDDLLCLTRRGVPVRNSVDINKVISSYLRSHEFSHLIQKHKNIKIFKTLSSSLNTIPGSELHIFKTIMNLVNNAVESMPDGGPLILITRNRIVDETKKGYDNIPPGLYSTLTVTDKGEGIPEQEIEKIFEPFYTNKTMGQSGTGLGMTIVLSTLRDHNAYIEIDSKQKRGTSFTLYFPSEKKDSTHEENTQSLIKSENLRGKGETILIAGKKKQTDFLSEILLKLNYSPLCLEDSDAFHSTLKKNKPELIITDIKETSDFKPAEYIRTVLQADKSQKIIITGTLPETDKISLNSESGTFRYLKRPYTVEKLARTIKLELTKQS